MEKVVFGLHRAAYGVGKNAVPFRDGFFRKYVRAFIMLSWYFA
jgi:hypothetical protein